MKKIIPFFSIFVFLIAGNIQAQSVTQVIRGTVVDEVTGFPLIGANILLQNSNPLNGTSSDENGSFVLKNVPLGRQSVTVSYVGYESSTISNLLVTSAKEIVVEVKLTEKVTSVDEVTVKAYTRKDQSLNDMAMVSSRSFTVEETERYAGSLGDPARMVANYAGVITQNDSRNDIIIRGNSPEGLLWRLEDIEIPNPNHFGALGTTGGPVSMLNNNLLANSDFLIGAFPSEYGNAIAGVFDLRMRSGNNEVPEYTGQVGFNGFELGAEGPFTVNKSGPRASYLANFRYSTLEVMNKLGINFGTGTAIPQYKDLSFLIDIPNTKLGHFKLIGLWGNSYIELGRNADDTSNNQYTTRGEAVNYGSELGVIGLSHTVFLNEDTRLKTTVSYQSTSSKAIVDSIKDKGEVTDAYYRGWMKEDKFSISSQFRQKLTARDNYSIGFIADFFTVNYLDSVEMPEYRRFITRTDIKGNLSLVRTYAEWQHKFTDNLSAYGGFNMMHFGLNGETAFEPRLSVKWSFDKGQSLSFGFGKHSMLQPKTVYFTQSYDTTTNTYSTTNKDVKFTRSNHFVISYDYLITKNLRVKIETYYQHLYHVPVKQSFPEFSMINTGDYFGIPHEDSLVNKGTGQNYGIEFTLEKFLSKGYYFLFTASIYDSKYKGYDGIERNTAFDGNYVFNLLGGYEIKAGKNKLFTFDLKTVWAGGRRFVPVDIAKSIEDGDEEYDWSKAYQHKYNDYFRTDLRIGFKMNSKHIWQEWAVDLQNVTGYKSLFMQGWDTEKAETYNVYQQGFFPMVLYRIQF